jgi:predicted nucleotidyltransferase
LRWGHAWGLNHTYTDDIDLAAKLEDWERFYDLLRPHGAFAGKAPYEALRERL